MIQNTNLKNSKMLHLYKDEKKEKEKKSMTLCAEQSKDIQTKCLVRKTNE
jgi:hypothetical protein